MRLYPDDPPSIPTFIPEGYLPLAKGIEDLECSWPELRQHLHAGRISGHILDKNNRTIPVPREDWASPKNDHADASGRAIILNKAMLGGRDREGFALVNTIDLEGIKKPKLEARQATAEAVSIPRPQANRKAATEQRNEAIQTAAEKIWKAEFKETGKLLRKEDVAMRLLATADNILRNHLKNHKTRDDGLLAQETLIRLISEPDWVREKRSKKKVIQAKNIPSC